MGTGERRWLQCSMYGVCTGERHSVFAGGVRVDVHDKQLVHLARRVRTTAQKPGLPLWLSSYSKPVDLTCQQQRSDPIRVLAPCAPLHAGGAPEPRRGGYARRLRPLLEIRGILGGSARRTLWHETGGGRAGRARCPRSARRCVARGPHQTLSARMSRNRQARSEVNVARIRVQAASQQ